MMRIKINHIKMSCLDTHSDESNIYEDYVEQFIEMCIHDLVAQGYQLIKTIGGYEIRSKEENKENESRNTFDSSQIEYQAALAIITKILQLHFDYVEDEEIDKEVKEIDKEVKEIDKEIEEIDKEIEEIDKEIEDEETEKEEMDDFEISIYDILAIICLIKNL